MVCREVYITRVRPPVASQIFEQRMALLVVCVSIVVHAAAKRPALVRCSCRKAGVRLRLAVNPSL